MSEPRGSTPNPRLRYAVDETPSEALTLGLSLQVVTLVVCLINDCTATSRGRRLAETAYLQGDCGRARHCATEVELQTCSSDTPLVLAGIIFVPIIVLDAAGYPDGVDWAVFIALIVSGMSTILQARRVGPIGAGYPLYMGTSGAFIGLSTAPVAAGGLPLLGTLVAASALVQFLFSARLSFLLPTDHADGRRHGHHAARRQRLPTATDLRAAVPPGVAPASMSGRLVAVAAFATITVVSLYAGAVRLWAPFMGILVGTSVAATNGMLDWAPLRTAAWFGVQQIGWPSLDLSLDAQFFSLFVPFVIVTIIGTIETYGDAIAIQRVSHRTPGGCPADSRRSVTTGPSRYPTFCNSARASSSSRCAFSIHRCW